MSHTGASQSWKAQLAGLRSQASIPRLPHQQCGLFFGGARVFSGELSPLHQAETT